LDIVVLAIS